MTKVRSSWVTVLPTANRNRCTCSHGRSLPVWCRAPACRPCLRWRSAARVDLWRQGCTSSRRCRATGRRIGRRTDGAVSQPGRLPVLALVHVGRPHVAAPNRHASHVDPRGRGQLLAQESGLAPTRTISSGATCEIGSSETIQC